MTNDDGFKPEGAPERSPEAGVGVPSGVDGNGPKRVSVHLKSAIVPPQPRGEPPTLRPLSTPPTSPNRTQGADAGSTTIGLYSLVCLPHCAFRNYIRFRRGPVAHPRLRVGNFTRPDNAAPSLLSHYKRFLATTSSSAPRSGIGILPHGVCHLSFPFASRARFSRSAPKPALSSCRLNTDCHRASRQVSSRFFLELLGDSSFDSSLNP